MKITFLGNFSIIKIRKYISLIVLVLTITVTNASDYYWIGGSGSWSDINHWSSTSGGTTIYNTPPSAFDNVFFDENSFTGLDQTVIVDIAEAVCRNLSWENVLYYPQLKDTNSVNFRIFGSLLLSNQMTFNYQGNFTFEAISAGHTINTKDHIIFGHLFFDGVGGEWTLENSIQVGGNIYLTNGTFNSNNFSISCHSFSSNNGNTRKFILGTSVINVFNWTLNGTNLVLDADESILNIGNGLTNYDSDNLYYYVVNFLDTLGSMLNSNAYAHYDTVGFPARGNVIGDCFINYLTFDSVGKVIGDDSIKYIRFGPKENSLLSGSSVVDSAFFNGNSTISGGNQIKVVRIKGESGIHGSNQIQNAKISGKATITSSNIITKIHIGDTAKIIDQNQFGNLFLNKMAYFFGLNFAENAFLNCGGCFHGKNTFDTLTFSPGKEYLFGKDSTQTINHQWNINGTCEAPIFLKSAFNGTKAYISVPNGSVFGNYLSIRDIHASGNTPFIANQTVDLGNNLNWNIDEVSSRNMYWVNGSGHWDEPDHWDIISGGPGGSCPPREVDNVYFDANSFPNENDSININVNFAVCNTMDWSGVNSSGFVGPDTNFLKLYGSLYFSENMNLGFLGETHFEATSPGKKIQSSNQVFNNDIKYQGIGGAWKLVDIFSTKDSIIHLNGNVNSNANNIKSKWFFISGNHNKQLDLNSDTVFLNGEGDAWKVNAENFIFDGDSSVIISQVGSVRTDCNSNLVYNNVHFYGENSELRNDSYCYYNLVTYNTVTGSIFNDCTIDTAIITAGNGYIYGNDIIKTIIFNTSDTSLLYGNSIVEIAYYHGPGVMEGMNQVDTALFYQQGYIKGENIIDTTIIHGEANIEGFNQIRTATLRRKGHFMGDNTFYELYLAPSKKYIFGHENKQTIVNKLVAQGLCTGPIILESDVDGKQASIEKLNEGLVLDYVYVKDIEALGPYIPFIANNSIDMGNNTNWYFFEPEPNALYWVGNSGFWSDSTHWANESGGQGGYCVPSPFDDVYFDHNSFTDTSEVILEMDFAFCRNMNWTGSLYKPIFKGGPPTQLNIYGSLILIDTSKLNFFFSGEVHFRSTEKDNTITSDGQTFQSSVWFDGREGEWSLNDSLSVNNDVYHMYGDIHTNGLTLRLGSYISIDTGLRMISLDTSEIYIISGWALNAENMILDADSSIFYSFDTISSFNGDKLFYNDIYFLEGGALNQESIFCYYDDVMFDYPGSLTGDCKIDSILFIRGGSISGNDSINYAYLSSGYIGPGSSIINTALFDSSGTVQGNNIIHYLIFDSVGVITGNNVIDTTIIHGDGQVHGGNTLKSTVNIYGNADINGENLFEGQVYIGKQGNIIGHNIITGNLIIEDLANIYVNNTINDALLNGSGNVGGTNFFNILTCTPGNVYSIEPNSTQTINTELNIRGNNCFFITLESNSTTNQQAFIHVPEGVVSGDFINMTRIVATGEAEFYAGGHSVNEGFNENWIWDNAPEYVYGFSSDPIQFCPEESYIITTENFNGNSSTIFEWSDGTISPDYEVSGPGSYPIKVFYSISPDTCLVLDTAYVELFNTPNLELGQDTEICEGDYFEFESLDYYDAFLWNDGSTESNIQVYEPGLYWVQVTDINGCTNSDSVNLDTIETPEVLLGEDTIIYNHDFIVLDAGYPGGIFEWSTGETTQTIEAPGIEGGEEYWVIVEYNSCIGTDTIVVDEFPYCTVDVPTAFSPNGDGINDIFYVYGLSIEILDLKIFNRYGDLVFESNDPEFGWDGNHKGEKQESDVFTFYLNAICVEGTITEKKGNITMLR